MEKPKRNREIKFTLEDKYIILMDSFLEMQGGKPRAKFIREAVIKEITKLYYEWKEKKSNQEEGESI